MQELFIALAHRPQGVATTDPEFDGFDPSQFGNITTRLRERGVLFRAKLSHRVVRWFDTEAKANEALQRASLRQSIYIKGNGGTKAHTTFAPSAVVTYPMNEDGTPAYKITRAVTPERSFRTGWGASQSQRSYAHL